MGISNGRAHLERQISTFISELNEKGKIAKVSTEAAAELPEVLTRITHLEQLVNAAELLLRENDPTWNCSRVKPKRKHAFKSPFPLGEAGPMALNVLRVASAPMTVGGQQQRRVRSGGAADYHHLRVRRRLHGRQPADARQGGEFGRGDPSHLLPLRRAGQQGRRDRAARGLGKLPRLILTSS